LFQSIHDPQYMLIPDDTLRYTTINTLLTNRARRLQYFFYLSLGNQKTMSFKNLKLFQSMGGIANWHEWLSIKPDYIG